MRLAVALSALALSACANGYGNSSDTVEMAVAKRALTGCLYDILPRGYYQTRFRGHWVVEPDRIGADGVPTVQALDGADTRRRAEIDACVRTRTLANPDFQEARARAS